MGNLIKDDTSKPAPKNKVSVLFIGALAVILAIVGVISWSFFGKHTQQTPPVTTASTTIEAPVEVLPDRIPAPEMPKAIEPQPQIPPEPADREVELETESVSKADTTPSTPEIPANADNDNTVDEAAKIPTAKSNFTEMSEAGLEPPAHQGDTKAPELTTIPEIIPSQTPEKLTPPDKPVQDVEAPNDRDTVTPSQTEMPEEIEKPHILAEEAPIETSTFPPLKQTTDTVLPESLEKEEKDHESGVPEDMSRDLSEGDVEPDTPFSSDLEIMEPPVSSVEDAEPESSGRISEEADGASEKTEHTDVNILNRSPHFSPPAIDVAPEEEADSASEALNTADTEITERAVEVSPTKILPPWQKFAAPFNLLDDRPRIAIVISEAGMNASRTREAIENLPAAVTLGFNPYGRNLQTLVDQARDAGHEVLLQLPMEPVGYPNINPGPQAMRTDLSEDENRKRLDWALNRFTGYAGITNQMGSKFTADAESIYPILTIIKEQGFLYLDSRTARNSVAAKIAEQLDIPVAINNRFLDHKADGALIDTRLAELEAIAHKTGSAIGIAYPHSETYRRLMAWAKNLDQKGLALAPVSALTKR